MPAPRSLLSLNEDILREILAHLLLDTPPPPNRASILRTCSLLHELELPFLYRVVDLQEFSSRALLVEQWKQLFGEGGIFTKGGEKGLGGLARELKVGVAREDGSLPRPIRIGERAGLALALAS